MRKGFHEPGEKPRRFYTRVEVRSGEAGHEVLLDGRPPRSEKGARLVLPTPALARLCADEWDAQVEVIDMTRLPATRLAFTALEAIPPARGPVADQFADYAGSDLLCYFAEAPQALAERQADAWGPVLDRMEAELGLRFVRAAGIRHQPQPPATLAAIRALALGADDFVLAGLAFGAPLYGSAILALAVRLGWISGAEALDLSRVDETFQEEVWGVDEEAAQRVARLRDEAWMLHHWFQGLKG